MEPSLDDAIAELRTLNVPVPRPRRLPTESEVEAAISDAGVGALCARSAVIGAWLNVQINAKDLKDEGARQDFLDRGRTMQDEAQRREAAILETVQQKL